MVVDGRRPVLSIGVDRAELIALLSGLGGVDAMEFDGGGSATLVARVLGEDRATVLNEPSDGVERPVADGLFVYSDTPAGPPARLVVRPAAIDALPDTAIPLHSMLTDAGGHPLGPAAGPWQIAGGGATIDAADVLHTGSLPLEGALQLTRGGASTTLPLEIVAAPARIAIAPEHPDVAAGASIDLHAAAFDEEAGRSTSAITSLGARCAGRSQRAARSRRALPTGSSPQRSARSNLAKSCASAGMRPRWPDLTPRGERSGTSRAFPSAAPVRLHSRARHAADQLRFSR